MKQFFVALSLFAAAFAFTAPAQAASQDECAIWICLPGGFPSGCGAAKSAMRDRIKDMKSPLPSFSSCAVNPPSGSGSHMTSDFGWAAYIPPRRVCTQYRRYGRDNEECVAYETLPEQYVRNTRCHVDRDGYRTPRYCTRTYRWAEVFVEGQLAGPTYYWD